MPDPQVSSRLHKEVLDGRCSLCDIDFWDVDDRVLYETKQKGERAKDQDKYAVQTLTALAAEGTSFPLYTIQPNTDASSFAVSRLNAAGEIERVKEFDRESLRKFHLWLHGFQYNVTPKAATATRWDERKLQARWFVALEGKKGDLLAVCIWLDREVHPGPGDRDLKFLVSLCNGGKAEIRQIVGRAPETTTARNRRLGARRL